LAQACPFWSVDPDGRGFVKKLNNWIIWNVWGEEEDVKKEEQKRRDMMLDLQKKNDGELIIQNFAGEWVRVDPATMNRVNVWLWSGQIYSSPGTRDLTSMEATNLIDATNRPGQLGTRINEGQQGKHIQGHNNYDPNRSRLTADPQELAQKAGTGRQVGNIPRGQPGFKERVDFGKVIGEYVDKAGNRIPTTKAIIHHSKSGIHIVPARP
jgi:hypothetical protein